MAKMLSLIVLGDSGSTIRHLTVSRKKIIWFSAFLLGLIAAVGVVVYQYIDLHSQMAGRERLEHQLTQQTGELVHQRQLIQDLARKLNALKSRLMALNQFEEKIRILANLEGAEDSDNVMGIGGSNPEIWNTDIDLSQKHDQLLQDLHEQIGLIGQASSRQQSIFESLMQKLEDKKNLLAHTPAIRPAEGWLTSGFEYRKSPFTGRREFHKGLDISNRKGTSVVATADGVISSYGEHGSFGREMIIDHGYGITTRYAHLDKNLKKKGEKVSRGDQVALMGNTGRSTGSHLHYEVRLNGVPVNPKKYILSE